MRKLILRTIVAVFIGLPLASQAKEVTITPSDDTYGRIGSERTINLPVLMLTA